MMRKRGGALALVALAVLGANDVSAQAEATQRRPGPRGGADAETIMAMRDRLELTEEQIAALDEIRSEAVALRSSHRSAMAEMRSRLRAGEIERSELMAFMEDLRASAPATREQRRERIEAVLDEAQLETLSQIRAERRAFARGRASVRRGGPALRDRRGPAMRDRRGPVMRDQRGPAMRDRRGPAVRGGRGFGPSMGPGAGRAGDAGPRARGFGAGGS